MIDQNTMIDWSRGLAAIVVAAGHLRNHMLPDYKAVAEPHVWFKGVAFVAGFGGFAVVVFFAISGWLVGGKLVKTIRDPSNLLKYAVDRITRLWIVLLPVFLIQMLAAGGSKYFFGSGPYSPAGGVELVGNLFGLQTILIPQFAGNYPLWSLANETVYYTLFPLLLLTMTSTYPIWQRILAAALFAAYAGLVVAADWRIIAYSVLWLSGAFASHVVLSRSWAIAFGVAFAIVLVGCRIMRIDYNLVADLTIALLFVATLSGLETLKAGTPQRALAQAGWLLASFSFTLYVIHVPIIQFMEFLLPNFKRLADPQTANGLMVYGGALIIILIAAHLFSSLTERHTGSVRRFVTQKVSPALAK